MTRTPEPASPDETRRTPAVTSPALRRITISAVVALLALWLGVRIGARAGGEETDASAHEQEHDHDHDRASSDPEVWTCSMHPQIRMSEPGDCPICGMDLIPAGDGGSGGMGMGELAADQVMLGARARALAQVRVREVRRSRPRSEVRLQGRVAYDETRLRSITSWTAGRIDRLGVRATGTTVRKGQGVAWIYSPEIYAALKELSVAKKQAGRLSGSDAAAALANRTVEAARERLVLLGLSEGEIDAAMSAKKLPRSVPVRATASGTVIERNVEQGDYVTAGQAVLEIADLSRVWIELEAYESDLPLLDIGQPVVVTVDALPGETFAGEVSFIDPVMDEIARVTTVRVVVDNPDGKLKPGMFADGVIADPGAAGVGASGDTGQDRGVLTIPASAVLWTGKRSIAYVEIPGAEMPTYELRTVELGPRAAEVYPVMSGLAEGERVVVSGAFVLDADLQLRGGASMMTRDPSSASVDEPRHSVSAEEGDALAPVFVAYLDVQAALADDAPDRAATAFGALAEAVPPVSFDDPDAAETWTPLASELSGTARKAAAAEDIAAQRLAFETISKLMTTVLERFGNPTPDPLRVAFCPMAFDAKGAAWIQSDGQVANPYYGEAMLRCGDFKARIDMGEHLPPPAEAP